MKDKNTLRANIIEAAETTRFNADRNRSSIEYKTGEEEANQQDKQIRPKTWVG